MKIQLSILLLIFFCANAMAGENPSTCSNDATRTYSALKRAVSTDKQRLWGKSIDGPFALINPDSREIENVTTSNGKPQCKAEKLPADKLIANTCMDWNNERTATLILPLPAAEKALVRLIAHERWHCLQKELNLPAQGDDNSHLDTFIGRTMLRMELRALRAALDSKNKQWRRAADDALYFRAQRSKEKKLNTGALLEEAKLEASEGLAEYTGLALSEDTTPDTSGLAANLEAADQKDSYMRSFAYLTGPAYGIMLERCRPGWTRQFKQGDDLPSLLAACLKTDAKLFSSQSIKNVGAGYAYNDVLKDETMRENTRKKRLSENTEMFVTGNYLELPLQQPNIQFNPNNLFVLPDVGTVYQGLTLNDSWGKLETLGPAIVDKNWQFVRVALKNDDCSIAGNGWVLSLNTGFSTSKNVNGKCAVIKK